MVKHGKMQHQKKARREKMAGVQGATCMKKEKRCRLRYGKRTITRVEILLMECTQFLGRILRSRKVFSYFSIFRRRPGEGGLTNQTN